jgi:hypothetical protein
VTPQKIARMADIGEAKVSIETFPELAGVEPNFHSAYDAVKSLFETGGGKIANWIEENKYKFVLFDSADPYLGYEVLANGIIRGTNMIGQLMMYFRDRRFGGKVWMPRETNPGWKNLIKQYYSGLKASTSGLFVRHDDALRMVRDMYGMSRYAYEQTILQTIILGYWAGMDPSLPGTIVSATNQDKARALNYLFARVSDPQTNEDLRLRKILLADERVELKELIPALRDVLVGFPSEDDYGPKNALVDLLQTPDVMKLLTGDTHSIFVDFFAYEVLNEGYSVEDALDRQFLYLEHPLY